MCTFFAPPGGRGGPQGGYPPFYPSILEILLKFAMGASNGPFFGPLLGAQNGARNRPGGKSEIPPPARAPRARAPGGGVVLGGTPLWPVLTIEWHVDERCCIDDVVAMVERC